MNLRQMIDMAGSILDYAPGVTIYENEVRRFLNEAYLDLYADRAWDFAQKTVLLSLKADRTQAGGVSSVTEITTAPTNFFTSDMAGMIVEISASANNDGEYIILSVDSATVATLTSLSGGAPGLVVEGGVTFKVKDRYVDLPPDTIEVMSLGIRSPENERLPFGYLNRWLDEHMALDIDLVARPTDWIVYDDVVLPQPQVAISPSVVAGASPVTGLFDFCYTFVRQNRESAPSPVSSTISITNAAAQTARFDSIQETSGTALLKRFYFRCPLSNRFYRALATDAAVTVVTITPIVYENPTNFLVNNAPLPEHEGRYQRVRLYPRQDKDYEATLRYVYRPQRMLDDSDVPEFPADFHRYLVYRTCQSLFVKHNNLPQSEMYKIKSEDELMRMQQRCLTQAANTWIKKTFRQSAIYRRPRPRLTHN